MTSRLFVGRMTGIWRIDWAKRFCCAAVSQKWGCDFIKQHVHSEWLGAGESDDFAECKPILQALKPDWLIIDHYWRLAKTGSSKPNDCCQTHKILAIDDLADRRTTVWDFAWPKFLAEKRIINRLCQVIASDYTRHALYAITGWVCQLASDEPKQT